MQPFSQRLPKPLVPVCGIPMVERLLRRIVESGFQNVTVVTGCDGFAIESHLDAIRSDFPPEVHLRFHREPEPRGNLGALGAIDARSSRVLLLFADLVTDLDFVRLLGVHRERNCNITLASHYENHRLRLGELRTEGARVIDYREKPTKTFLICSGIAVFDSMAVSVARELPTPFGISDLVRACLVRGQSVTHWTHGAYWRDVNTEDELREAESSIKDAPAHWETDERVPKGAHP